jgi:predicted nuclease with TOPRIM domain
MQVSMIVIVIVAESLLVAILGCIGLYLFYRKKKKLWLETFNTAKQRIRELKDVKRRYSFVKQNLHKLIEEKKKLLEELKDSENAPELREIIIELNSEIKKKSKKYKKIKATLKEKQDAVDELENELNEAPKAPEVVETEIKDVSENIADKSEDELAHLKSMNDEQKGLINKLKDEILSYSNGGEKPDEKILPRLEQMLKESETCIEMLEKELSLVVKELNEKSILLAQPDNQVPENEGAEEIKELKQQLDDTNSMTMTLMSANGDQSNIISFARNSISCSSLDLLAEEILKIVSSYGLEGSLQMRAKKDKLNKSENDLISQAHMTLLEDDLGGERFLEEGSRLVIRTDKISLLILGMPKDDPDVFARYRDSLAIILELATDSMSSIEDEDAMREQEQVLKKIISTTQTTLENVERQFKEQAEQSELIITSMTDVLGNPTFVKEMNVSFRPIYQGIVEETKERFDKLHKETAAVDESFSQIISI